MRTRIIAGALLLTAVAGAATLAARGNSFVGPDKQWTIVNFTDPVLVKGRFVMGPVLIVHDSDKMAKGEPCTTFYRFDPAAGQKEEIVSFHCKPRRAETVETTKLGVVSTDAGCKKLVEYQIAGDQEVHGVPAR